MSKKEPPFLSVSQTNHTSEVLDNIFSSLMRYEEGRADVGDLGNFIGMAIGNLPKEEINDFKRGINHGISLKDGTHPFPPPKWPKP